MSRDELVQKLARAGSRNDQEALRETMSALIAEAHAQQKHSHASRLRAVAGDGEGRPKSIKVSGMLPEALQSLLQESVPRRSIRDLVLERAIVTDIEEFLSEYRQASLLRSHSLEPRHTMLLVGPPGTGKTSLASAVAYDLSMPFFTVRYDGLVGSYLGETASRLQLIVDYASRIPCVLFFDEFESIGKERGDAQETGEIKRVVSSLLLHMDSIPSNCIVVCATNHPELLDRAVWRRFEVRLELPLPTTAALKDWFYRTEKALGPLGITAAEFTSILKGESFSELEAITLDARRKIVLSNGELKPSDAFRLACEAWRRRRSVGEQVKNGVKANSTDRPRGRTVKKNQGEAQASGPAGDLF